MSRHWRSEEWQVALSIADGPNVPIVPNVPNVPDLPDVDLTGFDDALDVLDCDEWDDLETSAWLAQASWASIRGDDPDGPFEMP